MLLLLRLVSSVVLLLSRRLRPVRSRKTSSSVGPATSTRLTGASAAARSWTICGTISAPPRVRIVTTLPARSTVASVGSRSTALSAIVASWTLPKPRVTRSPRPDLSAAAVSSAMTRPWSITTTRSAIASASSR